MKESIKTCLLDTSSIAQFDDELMRIIECEEASAQEVEEQHMHIGVRNEQGRVYRLIGVSGMGLYGKLLIEIQYFGFKNESQDKIPRERYDDILMK